MTRDNGFTLVIEGGEEYFIDNRNGDKYQRVREPGKPAFLRRVKPGQHQRVLHLAGKAEGVTHVPTAAAAGQRPTGRADYRKGLNPDAHWHIVFGG